MSITCHRPQAEETVFFRRFSKIRQLTDVFSRFRAYRPEVPPYRRPSGRNQVKFSIILLGRLHTPRTPSVDPVGVAPDPESSLLHRRGEVSSDIAQIVPIFRQSLKVAVLPALEVPLSKSKLSTNKSLFTDRSLQIVVKEGLAFKAKRWINGSQRSSHRVPKILIAGHPGGPNPA